MLPMLLFPSFEPHIARIWVNNLNIQHKKRHKHKPKWEFFITIMPSHFPSQSLVVFVVVFFSSNFKERKKCALCLLLLMLVFCVLLLLLLLILKTNKVEIMYHVFVRGIYRQHLKDRIWIGSFSSCFFFLCCLTHFNLFAFTYDPVWVYFLFKNSLLFVVAVCCCGFCGQYSSASRQSCHTHFFTLFFPFISAN